MAVNGYSIYAVHSEWAVGYNMNAYASRNYYTGPIPGTLRTVPASNISLNAFYGSSPDNEWPADGGAPSK